MNEQLDKQLCEKFPKMFRERNMPMSQTCMCWGFAHGDGWFNIINSLCGSIQHHVNWRREQRADALRFNRALRRAQRGDMAGLVWFYDRNDNEYMKKMAASRAQEALDKGEFRDVPDACPSVIVEQVKEKFGTLRFYYRGGDDVVDGMVRMAEAMSACTCEECGAPAHTDNHGGWVGTLCERHTKEREEKRNKGEW